MNICSCIIVQVLSGSVLITDFGVLRYKHVCFSPDLEGIYLWWKIVSLNYILS